MIIKLLYAGQMAKASHRRRLWLHPGQPVIIGPRKLLTVLEHQQDAEAELVMRVDVPGQTFEAPVPAGCELNLTAWAKLWAIPRAQELTADGRTHRLLVEFVRTSTAIQWAV